MPIKDFKDAKGLWAKSFCFNYRNSPTKSGQVWGNIQMRCKVGGIVQTKNPTYIGCVMSKNFQNFQFFAEWCQTQIGYGLEGYDIDKDILVEGNKEYRENKCVFVPHPLNSFLVANNSRRGKYPQGIHLSSCGQLKVNVCVNGKMQHVGIYKTEQEALIAYKAAKEEEAQRWHSRLCAKEFIVDPRVMERMRVWSFTKGVE